MAYNLGVRRALLLIVLLAGCARPVGAETRRAYADLLVPPHQCSAPGPEAVAPAALARDVDVLERALRRGYAGFELAGDEARWQRAFASLRAALPREPMAPLAFRDLLLEHVGFVGDGHVGLWVFDPRRRWRATSEHRQAYAAPAARFTRSDGGFVDASGRRLARCDDRPAAEVLRPVPGAALPALEYVPLVLSATPRGSIECAYDDGATESFPLERVDLEGRRGPAFERLEASFPWLRLRTLFPDRRADLERFVASAEDVRDAPVIVLDLRRGGGGSDGFLLDWFRRLTSQPIRYWETDALTSEATLQGALTFWGCVRASSSATGAGRAWLDARVARAERELASAMGERGLFRERRREALELDGLAPRPYRGRLLLVVDRGCGSACETSVMLARQLPGTLVVGENTEGTMKVGELRWYRLPESRVWISLGMRAHHDPSGRFEEGAGYLPDLWLVGPGADDQIRAIAACLADASCAASLGPARESARQGS